MVCIFRNGIDVVQFILTLNNATLVKHGLTYTYGYSAIHLCGHVLHVFALQFQSHRRFMASIYTIKWIDQI